MPSSVTATSISNGFRKSGLFPFTPDAINFENLIKNDQNSLQSAAVSEVLGAESIFRNPDSFVSPEVMVNYMNATLDDRLISEFRSSGSEWKGAEKHTSLFQFWKNHSDLVAAFVVEREEIVESFNEIQQFEGDNMAIVPGNEIVIDLSEVEFVGGANYEHVINSLCNDNERETPSIDKEGLVSTEETAIILGECLVDSATSMEVDVVPGDNDAGSVVASSIEHKPLTHDRNVPLPSGVTPLFRDTIFWPDRPPEKKTRKEEAQHGKTKNTSSFGS